MLVQLDAAKFRSGFDGVPAMQPGQVVDIRKSVANVDGVVIVGLGPESRPRTRGNRNLVDGAGWIGIVGVVRGAIEPEFDLVRQRGTEDVQQLKDSIHRRADPLLQVGNGGRNRLRIDGTVVVEAHEAGGSREKCWSSRSRAEFSFTTCVQEQVSRS